MSTSEHTGPQNGFDELVVGAVLTGSTVALDRAAGLATTSRDRQLVALAKAHLEGADDLFDALVRDHLATYPDHVLAAWLATRRSTT